jgi:hypothetical protein
MRMARGVMRRISIRWTVCLLAGVLLILACSACAPDETSAATPAPEGTYPVESVFREFYNLLGGDKNLGYAISPVIDSGTVEMQYTEGALMRYDAQAPASQKFSLTPLGLELHLSDQPIVLPEQSGARIVDGFIIYDEFVPIYDALQGARFVGKPLTQVRIDTQLGRIEQYFSNVGFYRLVNDPTKTVHLLAYGAWKCDAYCRYKGQPDAVIAPQPVIPQPLISSIARLGPDFSGQPLSAPYIAQDGMLEQIYENFVVYANPSNVRMISLRATPAMVGMQPTDLVPKMDDDRMVFYPIKPGLGHHVPKVFESYITLHGGLEISGMPTTELFQSGSIYRQCFTNYCLDYDPSAAEALRIRPAPLGQAYLKQYPPPQAAESAQNTTPTSYNLVVWEDRMLLPVGQDQKIHLKVTDAGSKAPALSLAATLTVYQPNDNQSSYSFQPTDAQGQAEVDVPAITGANGTLIPYQVCLDQNTGTPVCVKDSYVLWGNP